MEVPDAMWSFAENLCCNVVIPEKIFEKNFCPGSRERRDTYYHEIPDIFPLEKFRND